jgi:type IV pilus assembly protein PilO
MGSWPLPVKIVLLVIVFGGVLFGGYKLLITDELDMLERKERDEQTLRTEFASKQARAANLEAYQAQLEEMRRSFGAMLRQLPGRAEIDALLIDISQAGLAAGLQQELFAPQNEQTREFYAEVPIQIRLSGNYHQFGEFASAVAALPRIVTLHDINISRQGTDGRSLRMDVVAKTYRYLDESEEAAAQQPAAGRRGRR